MSRLEGGERDESPRPLWVEKQTCAAQKSMSALHPIATAKAKFRKTCAVQLAMSALGQKRTSRRSYPKPQEQLYPESPCACHSIRLEDAMRLKRKHFAAIGFAMLAVLTQSC